MYLRIYKCTYMYKFTCDVCTYTHVCEYECIHMHKEISNASFFKSKTLS